MEMENGAICVAASRDGQWIAAGSGNGGVFVWRATTPYEQVFARRNGSNTIVDIDFSPDSTILVSANLDSTAIIWDIAASRKVRTLNHDRSVAASKYSPEGDRIATATKESVRVWDSNDGRLLVDLKEGVYWRRSLLWCNNHLYIQTNDGKIKQIDAATGLTISEWLAPLARRSCIGMPQHGKFIACSTEKTITVWDTVTHAQLGPITHTHDIYSFAFSSDDSLFAIANVGSKIIVKKPFQSILVCSCPVFNPSYYFSLLLHILGPRT